ncbi:hypothetical protein BKX93_02930 [Chromobacterium vaccinii]|uniref:Uncharacterized protein n=1 Tax=Chromobacterium vaccinii TaxID=1108595 RepID=A0A1D9LCQ9_9NEIS|nr:hypothetical protein BKX93_02930 [Chromobacterium vaccinii]
MPAPYSLFVDTNFAIGLDDILPLIDSHNLYYVKSCMERIFKQTAKMLVTRFMSLLRNTQQKLTQVSYLASVSAS